jgi:hypothetical protein
VRKLFYHIVKRLPGLLLVVLAMVSAKAQIVIEQCDTMEFSVVSRPTIDESHFVWAIYNASPNPTDVLDPTTSLDPALYFTNGQYAGRTVSVVNLDPGEYYVRIEVWDEVSCTNNVEMYVLEVIESIPDVELYGDSVCIGDPATVTIRFTGVGPYTISYTYGDENTGTFVNMNGVVVDGPKVVIPILEPLPVGENSFWLISIEDDCKAYEFPIDERPGTGVRIYPKPSNSQIYQVDK